MKGGYQILDLQKISVGVGDVDVAITDEEVTKQLLKLSSFINIQTGLLITQLKPILLILSDMVCFATLSLTDENILQIDGKLSNGLFTMQINYNVVTENENQSFVVQSAKYSYITVSETVKGDIITLLGSGNVPSIKGDSIIQNMSGYSFLPVTKENITIENIYVGAVINGNKITFVQYINATRTGDVANDLANIGQFTIPEEVYNKLIPDSNSWLELKQIYCANSANSGKIIPALVEKITNNRIVFRLLGLSNLTIDTQYRIRFEVTFLLSKNLTPQGE